jgi:hypothetical protein
MVFNSSYPFTLGVPGGDQDFRRDLQAAREKNGACMSQENNKKNNPPGTSLQSICL